MAKCPRLDKLADFFWDPQQQTIVRNMLPIPADDVLEAAGPASESSVRACQSEVTTEWRSRNAAGISGQLASASHEHSSDIQYKLIRNKGSVAPSSGMVFQHAEAVCERVIQAHGGPELAVIKIGITANPEVRWSFYQMENFQQMVITHSSDDLSQIESLEAHLIRLFKHLKGSRNDLPGGESMRRKDKSPRFPPPYLCYIVGVPANVRARVGS